MSWAASCAPRCGREAASSATISRVTPDFAAPIGTRSPVVQGDGRNAERLLPIVHVPFSNVKTWLNGTYHGVSAKHLARYAREWNDRVNRRTRIADLADSVLQRAVARPTITYRESVNGLQPQGALPALTA